MGSRSYELAGQSLLNLPERGGHHGAPGVVRGWLRKLQTQKTFVSSRLYSLNFWITDPTRVLRLLCRCKGAPIASCAAIQEPLRGHSQLTWYSLKSRYCLHCYLVLLLTPTQDKEIKDILFRSESAQLQDWHLMKKMRQALPHNMVRRISSVPRIRANRFRATATSPKPIGPFMSCCARLIHFVFTFVTLASNAFITGVSKVNNGVNQEKTFAWYLSSQDRCVQVSSSWLLLNVVKW